MVYNPPLLNRPPPPGALGPGEGEARGPHVKNFCGHAYFGSQVCMRRGGASFLGEVDILLNAFFGIPSKGFATMHLYLFLFGNGWKQLGTLHDIQGLRLEFVPLSPSISQ